MESLIPDNLIVDSNELHFEKQIGIGGYSEVWKGTWEGKGAGTTVAIKKIPLTGVTATSQKRIMNEVNILSKLHHPLLLQIFGACLVEKELWIVTEFIDGGSLFDLLHADVELSWEIRLRLAHQAAASVHVLHSSGIVHRDIKSLNFLVSTDCEKLKLIDFGLSKYTATVSTVPRKAIGTLRWCAPEILCNIPQWSPESDIYSLGVTFWEIASRKIPFEDVLDEVIMQLIMGQTRLSIPDDCPQWFKSIITACWNHDPTKRPTSQMLVNMLKELVNNAEEKELSWHLYSLLEGTALPTLIYKWLPKRTFSLLYKATRDGFSRKQFHKMCDYKGATISIIKSDEGYLFGGYTPKEWGIDLKQIPQAKRDSINPDFFLFTITNPHNIPPTQYFLKDPNDAHAHRSSGNHVVFGQELPDICIACEDAHLTDDSYAFLDSSYKDTTGKSFTTFTGSMNFRVKEIEVYQVI